MAANRYRGVACIPLDARHREDGLGHPGRGRQWGRRHQRSGVHRGPGTDHVGRAACGRVDPGRNEDRPRYARRTEQFCDRRRQVRADGGQCPHPVRRVARRAVVGGGNGNGRRHAWRAQERRPREQQSGRARRLERRRAGPVLHFSRVRLDAPEGMRDLGSLGGSSSVAFDMSDRTRVVGNSLTAANDWHAFS